MYSSLRGSMDGGGTSSVKRSFPVAPGETIRKGDAVTVFDNQVYRNAERPFDTLPKFSPDVLYLQPGEQSRAVHPIGPDSFIQIGTTDDHIRISRCTAGADGIVVQASKLLPVYGVEGINRFMFKPLTESAGILCYLEHNTEQWRMAVLRWPGTDELALGAFFVTELNTAELPAFESVTENTFLMVWHCMKAAPPRMKAVVCVIGNDHSIAMAGNAYAFEVVDLLSDKFALAKLSAGRYALNYWIGDAQPSPSLVTQMLFVQDRAVVFGEKGVLKPAVGTNVEMRTLVLSPDHYILMQKLDGKLNLYDIVMQTNKPILSPTPYQISINEPFYDAVALTDQRFVLAFNNRNTGAIVTALFDASGGTVKLMSGKEHFNRIRGLYNKLRFVPLGDSLFVLTFNAEASAYYDFTQALMLRLTADMTAFEEVNVKEQLINVWDQGCAAEYFQFCALGSGGRFVASGSGRIKLFRCGWSTTRFISGGVGEFASVTGDYYVNGLLFDSVALSNGYVALAYRERDTWHGKLSVFEPVPGGYRPIASHTFSYSHVDNLSITKIRPGKIALQYRQRIAPSYDGNMTSGYEVRVLAANVSGAGLTEKLTTSLEPEPYNYTRLFPLAGDRLLVIGLDYRITLFARVFRIQETPTFGFVPLGEPFILDYERADFTVSRLGANLFSATSAGTRLVEVTPDGAIHASGKFYEFVNGSEVHGILEEAEGSVTMLMNDLVSKQLETVRFARLGDGLYQSSDPVARKTKMYQLASELRRMRGKAAFLIKAGWAKGMDSQPGRPVQDIWVAMLDTSRSPDGAPPKDRYYPFPSSPNAAPVFLPIDDDRAFCVLSDGQNNQLYAVAYLDEEHLSYGRPYLTPSGIAGSDGSEGRQVEVTLRGIAETAVPLKAGASYYSGMNGELTVDPRGRRVGRAVSAREILIESD